MSSFPCPRGPERGAGTRQYRLCSGSDQSCGIGGIKSNRGMGQGALDFTCHPEQTDGKSRCRKIDGTNRSILAVTQQSARFALTLNGKRSNATSSTGRALLQSQSSTGYGTDQQLTGMPMPQACFRSASVMFERPWKRSSKGSAKLKLQLRRWSRLSRRIPRSTPPVNGWTGASTST